LRQPNSAPLTTWQIRVVLHVGVVREQFTVAIHGRVKDIPKTGCVGFKLFAFRIDSVNDSARREPSVIVASTVRHAGKEMIFPPDLWNLRCFSQFRWVGVVTGDQEQRLAIGAWHNGVDTVISPRLEFPQ
jgi:hypothetical protein